MLANPEVNAVPLIQEPLDLSDRKVSYEQPKMLDPT